MIPAQLARDLTETLARLQIARLVGDESEARVSERRLNWLIDKIPVKEKDLVT
jgi:hypothetical protein